MTFKFVNDNTSLKISDAATNNVLFVGNISDITFKKLSDKIFQVCVIGTNKYLVFNYTDVTSPNSANFSTIDDFLAYISYFNSNSAYFGDGGDGDLTISAGTVTLVRPTYYKTLTINGTGQLIANCYPVFCKVLDLSNAPANAIIAYTILTTSDGLINGGGPFTGSATAQFYGTGGNGGGPSNAGTNGGGNGNTVAIPNNVLGGSGGASGAGGANGAGNGGGIGRPIQSATTTYTIKFPTIMMLRGTAAYSGGIGGAGGGGGGGDGVSSSGGGGGGGGAGGPILGIFAEKIILSASTAQDAISNSGGRGGNGYTHLTGNRGGCGGGAGGGGGFTYILYSKIVNPNVAPTRIISVNGGNGGNGGNGFGTGFGGQGGNGGLAGNIVAINMLTGAITTNTSATSINTPNVPADINGTAGSSGSLSGITF